MTFVFVENPNINGCRIVWEIEVPFRNGKTYAVFFANWRDHTDVIFLSIVVWLERSRLLLRTFKTVRYVCTTITDVERTLFRLHIYMAAKIGEIAGLNTVIRNRVPFFFKSECSISWKKMNSYKSQILKCSDYVRKLSTELHYLLLRAGFFP